MTAIVIGRTLKANFIIVDSMVENNPEINSYKDCRLKDKITNIVSSEQYLVLTGQELIANGASFLNSWCEMKNIKIDLFNPEHFEEVLKIAFRYKQYSADVMNFKNDIQGNSDVYIVSRDHIKHYEVNYTDEVFNITNQGYLKNDTVILNYKGNVKNLSLPFESENYIQYGIDKLKEEHELRKSSGINENKTPLKYDFEDYFSSVLLPSLKSEEVERNYPFKFLTELFLEYKAEWNYVKSKSFEYSPFKVN